MNSFMYFINNCFNILSIECWSSAIMRSLLAIPILLRDSPSSKTYLPKINTKCLFWIHFLLKFTRSVYCFHVCVNEGLIIIFGFSETKGVKSSKEIDSEACLENKRCSSTISLSRYVDGWIYEYMKSQGHVQEVAKGFLQIFRIDYGIIDLYLVYYTPWGNLCQLRSYNIKL